MKNALHLTQGFPDALAAKIEATPPGMAHWAGTGPAGAECGDCAHWNKGRKITIGPKGETPRHRRRCSMNTRLHQGVQGNAIEPSRPACRHFKKREVEQ